VIDRRARLKALDLIAQIPAGAITNWELEDQWPRADQDPALACILRWLWTLYDDDQAVRMIEVLRQRELAILERCKQFLKSDEEFRLRTLSADEARSEQQEWGTEWAPGCTLPDNDNWPFSS
jgi:hypothetical protein